MVDPGAGILVLDTHVWIWMMEGVPGVLSEAAIEVIEQAGEGGNVRVCAISVWEVAMLEAKGRISLSRPIEEWVRAALRATGVRLLPLTPEIAIGSTRLPGQPHSDPADRLIMASARLTAGRLVTCDEAIVTYSRGGNLAVLDARP